MPQAQGPDKKGDVSSVRAVLQQAKRRAPKREAFRDPAPNEPMQVSGEPIKPGEWAPDFFGLPPSCPVEPLGMEGDILFLMDAMGQMRTCEPGKMGQKQIQSWFGERQNYLYWAWPRYDKNGVVASWRPEKVSECLYTAAARRGLFSPVDKVRGRGAWQDANGVLIYHSGDALWRTDTVDRSKNFVPQDTGFAAGVLYPRRPAIAAPWPEPVVLKNNPSRALILALRSWTWARPEVDPILMLGHLAAALIGGALKWRPTVFVVGDKAVGKSTLQENFYKAVLGDAVIQSADTTAAGIYQQINQDSLAIAVDELEAEADNRKVVQVIKLARLAASGAMMFRGGSDHTGVQFRARSTFFFSAINAPPLQAQDLSRMAVLHLRKRDKASSGDKPVVINTDEAGPMLLRRIMDEWSRFDGAYAAYRDVLRGAGHDGRGQDTLGTLLALADLCLGPELAEELAIPMVDDLARWGDLLAPKTIVEYSDNSENWVKCLKAILRTPVEAWRNGTTTTVGALVDEIKASYGAPVEGDGVTLKQGKKLLAQAGVAVGVPSEFSDQADGWVLCIPNESQHLWKLLRDTEFAGNPGASVWKTALRQGPFEVIFSDPKINRVRINGVQERCILVKLGNFDTYMKED